MPKEFSREEKSASLLLATLVAWGCVLAGYHFARGNENNHQMLLVYAVTGGGLVLALLLYRLFLLFSHHNPLAAKVLSKPAAGAAVLLAFAGVVALQAHRSIVEKDSSELIYQDAIDYLPGKLWFKIPWVWSALFCLACFAFAFSLYRKEKKRSDQTLSLPVAVVYLLSAILFALSTYAPTPLNNDPGHMIAALQTVYNVAFDTPFTIRSSGIYGHYAVFFWPFLKIFGHTPQAVAAMMSAVSFLTQLLLVYTLHHSVKSDVLRILGALASVMTITVYSFSSYYQLWPLRIFPPALVLAYITYSHVHTNPKHPLRRIIAGYGVCAIAITFATDVGLVGTLVYTAWLCRCAMKDNAVFSRAMGRVYLTAFCGCAGALCGFVAIINFYNLVICRGQPVLRACFFPLIGGKVGNQEFATGLQMALPKGDYSWLWVMALFFVAVLIGVAGTTLLPFKGPADGDLLFAIAVMGLGASFYYLNRAAYLNLTIALPEAVLCMAFLIDHLLGGRQGAEAGASFSGKLCKGAALAVFLELSVLAAVTLVFGGSSIETHIDAGHYSTEPLAALARQVEETVPKDTYAYGAFVQEIYAYLGWDPGYHLRDSSDMFGDGIEDVFAELNRQPSLLIHAYYIDYLDPDAGLVQQFGIPADNPILYYYTRQ